MLLVIIVQRINPHSALSRVWEMTAHHSGKPPVFSLVDYLSGNARQVLFTFFYKAHSVGNSDYFIVPAWKVDFQGIAGSWAGEERFGV